MNINYYDTDCSTWFPTGKLYQVQTTDIPVEYATKAVDQGSIVIGLRSGTHAVLVCQKRSSSQLSGYQDKVFEISDKIGMGIAGITADARVICKYMRTECLNHKYVYGSQHPIQRLVLKVAEKSQHKTQVSGKRPYGVGTLLIAHDVTSAKISISHISSLQQDGPHLFQTLPSGDFFEFHGYSIGARSQTARTYLEANMTQFKQTTLENLILHGLAALKKANQGDDEFQSQSVDVAFVGPDCSFTLANQSQVDQYLAQLATWNPNAEMEIEQQ